MLDYYTLKEQIKRILLLRWQNADLSIDPYSWSWFINAITLEGTNNPLLKPAMDQGKRWLESELAWKSDVELQSVGLFRWILQRVNDPDLNNIYSKTTSRITTRIQHFFDKGITKFSRLNDPDVVFCLSLGIKDDGPTDLIKLLREHCERNAQPGHWRRTLMFAAAATELGGTITPFTINGSDLLVNEIISAIWFSERYPNLIDGEHRRKALWEAFEKIKEGFSWEETEIGILHTASSIDVAMFFEALLKQTSTISPATLFNNIPWHPAIRTASESLYIKQEYVSAIFEAAKLYVDAVKHKASNPVDRAGKPLDGVNLMDYVFKLSGPVLKFNNLSNQSEENDHSGLLLISKGIVSAFRNPKGHLPAAAISLNAYEALEQLAILSYLMRRLDNAHL